MTNILIADDSKTMRMQISNVVRELLDDANIRYAEDGAGVLKAWHDIHPPNLTILDIHMPVLNGLEVMRHLLASGTKIPKVIIYTASRDDAMRQQCLDAGAAAVIIKSRENIHEAIRTALQIPNI
ncbi:MAG: response regulator transcription factor [Deltaproteobacteria bacterium]|nr:response regulator transcription factor [Deltaproteobacteria bacterium]